MIILQHLRDHYSTITTVAHCVAIGAYSYSPPGYQGSDHHSQGGAGQDLQDFNYFIVYLGNICNYFILYLVIFAIVLPPRSNTRTVARLHGKVTTYSPCLYRGHYPSSLDISRRSQVTQDLNHPTHLNICNTIVTGKYPSLPRTCKDQINSQFLFHPEYQNLRYDP